MYSIGCKVVHPAYGAGEIILISQKSIGERSSSYYVIDMAAAPHMTRLLVPVHRAEDIGLRQVGKVSRLREVLGHCAEPPEEGDVNRDYRSRYADMCGHMKSGNFAEVVDAVRVLHYLNHQRPLGHTEKEIFRQGKGILAGELALAGDQELDEAMGELEDRLAQMTDVQTDD